MKDKQDLWQRQYVDYTCRHYQLFEWFLLNQKLLQNFERFDYPDYGGIPRKFKLSNELKDKIQDMWPYIKKVKSMTQLCKLLLP